MSTTDDSSSPSRLRSKLQGARGEAILQRAPELQSHLSNYGYSAETIVEGGNSALTQLLTMPGCPSVNFNATQEEVDKQMLELGNFCRDLIPVANYLAAFPACQAIIQRGDDSALDELKATVTKYMETTPFDVAQEKDGRTLLSYATTDSIASYLLEFESVKAALLANTNVMTSLVSQQAAFSIVKAVIEAGGSTETDASSEGLLGHAVQRYDDEQFKYVVSKVTLEQIDFVPPSWGWSFIETAIRYGYTEKALTLATRGASLTAANGISSIASLTDAEHIRRLLTAHPSYKETLLPLLPYSLAVNATLYVDTAFLSELKELGADPAAETREACAALGRRPAELLWLESGVTDRLLKLIELGTDVNKVLDDNGNTMLHLASSTGVTDALVAAGANVNAKNNNGDTPAMAAMAAGRTDAAYSLLRSDQIDIINNNGQSILDLALSNGTYVVERLLSEHGEAVKAANLVNRAAADGTTPLILAINRCDITLLSALIAAGGDARQRGADGRTPAMVCATSWDAGLAALIDAQGDLDLETTDNEGHTLLWWVSTVANVDRMNQLLDKGASLHARDAATNSTVLLNYLAVETYLDVALVKRLVEAMTVEELTAARTTDGLTPALALLKTKYAYEGMPECFQLLREKGAVPLDAKDNTNTVVSYCISYADHSTNREFLFNLVKEWIAAHAAAGTLEAYLTEQKADFTTIHYAAYRGSSFGDAFNNMFELLLAAAPSLIDAPRPSDGDTPLMVAAYGNNPGGVQLLLERGAKVDVENKAGLNVLEINTNSTICSMLVEKGARIRPEKATAALFADDLTAILGDQLAGAPASAQLFMNAISSSVESESFAVKHVLRGLEAKNFDFNEEVEGNTVLHRLAYIGNNSGDSYYYWLQKLIAAGVDVNLARADGVTPLFEAIRGTNRGALELLLAAPGIDVNKMSNGETPLTYVAINSKPADVAEMLLKAGANKALPNAEGKLPYDLTCDYYLQPMLALAPAEAAAPEAAAAAPAETSA